MITLLDGPLGTELTARGVSTALPLWSASAIDSAPEVVASIHRDYAIAGATIHTANTFRTKRRNVGEDWRRMTREAVAITREALANLPTDRELLSNDRTEHLIAGGNRIAGVHRIAGSISPLEDCYRPDLSPRHDARDEHREMAEALAEARCDLLLCETFPQADEALVAVEESVRTGLETWLALTAGPQADLLSPQQMADAARRAVDAGAQAVLVNCTPAAESLRYVAALSGQSGGQSLGVPIGVYANAGRPDDEVGWVSTTEIANQERGARIYREMAREWIAAGATIVGGCCGTSPAHIAELHRAFIES